MDNYSTPCALCATIAWLILGPPAATTALAVAVVLIVASAGAFYLFGWSPPVDRLSALPWLH